MLKLLALLIALGLASPAFTQDDYATWLGQLEALAERNGHELHIPHFQSYHAAGLTPEEAYEKDRIERIWFEEDQYQAMVDEGGQ